MTRHTQDEIVARIYEIKDSDFFGTQIANLISALDLTHGQPFLKEEAWSTWKPFTDEAIRTEAREYLEFAVEKAINHRGLSAARSVDHYSAWVWLLEPDRFEEFETAPYQNYGAPILKAAALALDFADEWYRLVDLRPEIANMAEGKPCEPGCYEGCGS